MVLDLNVVVPCEPPITEPTIAACCRQTQSISLGIATMRLQMAPVIYQQELNVQATPSALVTRALQTARHALVRFAHYLALGWSLA